jgi:hypothetical protein
MNQECIFVQTIGHLPIIYCYPKADKECVLFTDCPACESWSERGCHVVFYCRVCHQLCCDRCVGKGFHILYCPHCGCGATLEPHGHSCDYPTFLRGGLALSRGRFEEPFT